MRPSGLERVRVCVDYRGACEPMCSVGRSAFPLIRRTHKLQARHVTSQRKIARGKALDAQHTCHAKAPRGPRSGTCEVALSQRLAMRGNVFSTPIPRAMLETKGIRHECAGSRCAVVIAVAVAVMMAVCAVHKQPCGRQDSGGLAKGEGSHNTHGTGTAHALSLSHVPGTVPRQRLRLIRHRHG